MAVQQPLLQSERLLFYWRLLSQDLEWVGGQELLTMIIDLWIANQRVSFAKSVTKKYKQAQGAYTSKAKALRKGLTQPGNATDIKGD